MQSGTTQKGEAPRGGLYFLRVVDRRLLKRVLPMYPVHCVTHVSGPDLVDLWWAWVDLNHRPRPYQYCGHWSRAKNLPSPFRYFDFRVTTRRRPVHRGDDTLNMQAEYWPSRITEHAERDCANRQVLLVADILVGGDEHIKSSGLGRF